MPLVLLAVPAYQIFALCATRLWLHVLGDPASGDKLLITPTGAYSWLLIALLSATFAPLLEELVIRGRLQTGLERSLHPAVAILLTSLIFASMHLSLVGFPIALIHGLIFGAVVSRTGSVWTSVILHMANNILLIPISIFGLFGLEHPLSVRAVALMIAGLLLALGALGAIGWCIWRLPRITEVPANPRN